MKPFAYSLLVLGCGAIAGLAVLVLDRGAARLLQPATTAAAGSSDASPDTSAPKPAAPRTVRTTAALPSPSAVTAPPATTKPPVASGGGIGHRGDAEVLFTMHANLQWSHLQDYCRRSEARVVTVQSGPEGVFAAEEHGGVAGPYAIAGGAPWNSYVAEHPGDRWLWIECPADMKPLRELAAAGRQFFLLLPPHEAAVVWGCCPKSEKSPGEAVVTVHAQLVVDEQGRAQMRAHKEA